MDVEEFIKAWSLRQSYTDDLLFIEKLRAHLLPEQILHVLQTIDSTCLNCFDSDKGCQCANDD